MTTKSPPAPLPPATAAATASSSTGGQRRKSKDLKELLTEAEFEGLRIAFRLVDRNQDGVVNVVELHQMLSKLGVDLDPEILQDLMVNLSKSGNKQMDENDFLYFINKINMLQQQHEEEAMAMMDEDETAAAAAAAATAANNQTTTSNITSSSSSRSDFNNNCSARNDVSSGSVGGKKSERKRQNSRDDLADDLQAAFNIFDSNRKGYISRHELPQVMDMLGETLTDRELDRIWRIADIDKDGKLSYNDFAQALLQ